MDAPKRVYAVFRGYMTDFGEKSEHFDEWLCGLFLLENDARDAVEEFGCGRPWDTNRESQITRYYEKSSSSFEPGREVDAIVKGGEKRWVRYEPIPVQGA